LIRHHAKGGNMNYKTLGFGLGLFSLALGAFEILAARKIARALDSEDHVNLVRGFGARELAAGVALVVSPAVSTNVWMRVVGDAMDIGALSAAADRSPRNRAIWAALAFVGAATALDIFTARGLDRTTAKMLPTYA